VERDCSLEAGLKKKRAGKNGSTSRGTGVGFLSPGSCELVAKGGLSLVRDDERSFLRASTWEGVSWDWLGYEPA